MTIRVMLPAFLLLAAAQAVRAEKAIESAGYRYFMVQEKDGKVAEVLPLVEDTPPQWAKDVSRKKADWSGGPKADEAVFEGPIPFVITPTDTGETFLKHNHQPSITWLDNGDLLAIWYTTGEEKGTELTVLASRLRKGKHVWDPSSVFFKAPNRNMHGSGILRDDSGKLYHLNGMAREGAMGWDKLAFLMRTSIDHGVTWSQPVVAGPEYKGRQQIISGGIINKQGVILQNCDAVPGSEGGTALQISTDHGLTWSDPGAGKPTPDFKAGGTGEGTIAGIHAGIVELTDGRIMALGRGNSIDGKMPRSISANLGKTWTYDASPFPPIGSGQRLVLKRLKEGPLLLVSFTSADRKQPRATGLMFTDTKGGGYICYGMYAALSLDDGKTWPYRRLLTPGSGTYDGGAWTSTFTATPDQAEHAGYLACTQTPDGIIHLISSRLHYRFNLAWLKK